MKTFEINGVEKTLHEWHMELWNWLADNPEKEKIDWFKLKFNDNYYNEVYSDCFACQCANYDSFDWIHCKKCPIIWGNEEFQSDIFCINNLEDAFINTLFDKWTYESDMVKRSEYAHQIANLPWNESEED